MAFLDGKELKQCKRLAKQGNVDAQYRLGDHYYIKYIMKNRNPKAVKWFTIAANNGHAEAQFQLGEWYRIGMFVLINKDKSTYYYKKAAAQGHVKAQEKLGIKPTVSQSAKADVKNVSQPTSTTQTVKHSTPLDKHTQDLLKDKNPTINTLKQLANAGMQLNSPLTEREKFGIMVNSVLGGEIKANDDLCYSIASSYFYGKHGAPVNYEKAVYWWQKAAIHKHADSQCALAYCYQWGYGVKQSDSSAEYWLFSAARNGNENARQAIREAGKHW